MSYNPRRQQGLVRPRRERRLDPRSGVRHSDIMAARGPSAASILDVRAREATFRGWKVVVHRGESFEMVYEYICARNASGVVRSAQDRALRVLFGELYITVGGNQIHLQGGMSFSIPAGTEYELATAGVGDAELIFCQGPHYEETLEQISEPGATNAQTNVVLPAEPMRLERVSTEQARKHAEQQAIQRHRREMGRREFVKGHQPAPTGQSNEAQAAEQAADVEAVTAAASGGRRPPVRRPPMSGQTVVGVNPRPVGASGYGD